MANKNYCPIHHLYYSGSECPMCREERTAMYIKKYGDSTVSPNTEKEVPKKHKTNNDRGINDEDISKLMEKFNGKVGK